MDGPESVTSVSPSPSINESDLPYGKIALPVCDAGGGGENHAGTERFDHEASDQAEPPIIERLRAFGVRHTPTMRQCSAAPNRAAEVLHACVAKGGGPGLFYEMWHKGVWGTWKTCGKRVDNSPAVPLDGDDAGHDKYINGALGRYVRTGLEELPSGGDAPTTPESERERRDAERTSSDGGVPPDDDPDLAKYRGMGGLPQWDEEGAT